MHASFKRNLIIGFGISLLLLIASSVASFISIRNLLHNQDMIDRANNVIIDLENVLSILKDGETGQRGFLLTGQPEFLEPYNGALENAQRLIDEVQALTRDNPAQQESIAQLKNAVSKQFTLLQALIDDKQQGVAPPLSDLNNGRALMDEIRDLAQQMKTREETLRHERTSNVSQFAGYTSGLILIASLLAIILTTVSFFRVNADFEKRRKLQDELQQKNKDVTDRITIIQGLADKISAGDYKIRVDDATQDLLGSLAGSLNKMAISLDNSFTRLAESEWQQTGIATLNEKMLGEKEPLELTYNIMQFITGYTNSQLGAFYLLQQEDNLELSATVGLNRSSVKQEIALGEGLAGQSALSGREIVLENVAEAEMVVNYAAGGIKPASIIALPVFHERNLKGVIEMASLQNYSPAARTFLQSAAYNIGMAIQSAHNHRHLQELLAETQAQAEELQAQHTELENINTELEAQSQKLQASEEELKVQQEELQQANQELEERSRLLEEKNELILERNMDIQAKAAALEQSTRYKSEFLANMSHELRTPLNSILLLSRLLAENNHGNLNKEQIEYATVIQSSGNGLLTLIDEILDLSKIESGKMELEYNFVAVEDISNEMKALFTPLAKDKGIAFRVEMKEPIPQMIETDRLRLQQILRNLISNALKFTARGAVTLRMATERTDTISFTVEDTGIGIPADKQQTVFEAFQQADGSTRRKYGGTGLGLSISRELARLLGGTISLQSEEGKGSAFTLTLPLQQGSNTAAPATTARQETEQPADRYVHQYYIADHIPAGIPDDRDQVSPDDKVILIIEDDTGFALSLLDYTRQKGYKGMVAVRGDEGLALARQFRPAGILLDIQLPVKSGWEVMEELKSDPATRPIPVHIMSVHEVKTRSLSRGAVDFINKPVALDQLGAVFQKIEQVLSRHPQKVLIVEENPKHAQALAYFLQRFDIAATIRNTVDEGIQALNLNEANCVILDMGVASEHTYDILEEVKKTPGFESLPIIIFTGRNLSHQEELRIRQYADSIVIKTAHSYQRILDEVSLFLHLVEENKKDPITGGHKRMGELGEVLKGKTVLVADDDVRNIFSLTKALEAYGMKVVSAIDGREALQQLESTPKVDLVLMDMMMPEMDGYESTRRIREILAYKKLPVIAVTAKAMAGDREKCIAAGASDYITKPMDVDQLISLLRVWLYE